MKLIPGELELDEMTRLLAKLGLDERSAVVHARSLELLYVLEWRLTILRARGDNDRASGYARAIVDLYGIRLSSAIEPRRAFIEDNALRVSNLDV